MVKNLPITQEMQETQLQSLCWEDPLEEEMATPSKILARRIPWTAEAGGLQYLWLQRVQHDQTRTHHYYYFVLPTQWHPTPVLLPGNSHGRRSLEGCSPWGRWGSDTTERLHFHFHALEKEMATPSSVLAWRIPGTGEPGGLPSLGSHRVGHDWSSLAAAAAAAHKLLGAGQDASVLSHDYCPPSPPALILWILVMCHSVLSPFKAYGYRYVCFCGYNFFP